MEDYYRDTSTLGIIPVEDPIVGHSGPSVTPLFSQSSPVRLFVHPSSALHPPGGLQPSVGFFFGVNDVAPEESPSIFSPHITAGKFPYLSFVYKSTFFAIFFLLLLY